MKKTFLSLALLALVVVGCVSATTMKKKKEKDEYIQTHPCESWGLMECGKTGIYTAAVIKKRIEELKALYEFEKDSYESKVQSIITNLQKVSCYKKLIAEAFDGEKIVLIENEFGEIGIDGGFLQDAGINITEMNSGCICCSLVGDFGRALTQVIADYDPDRIIIEPSGVGKLSDVIAAVEKVTNENVKLGYTVAVVDAGKAAVLHPDILVQPTVTPLGAAPAGEHRVTVEQNFAFFHRLFLVLEDLFFQPVYLERDIIHNKSTSFLKLYIQTKSYQSNILLYNNIRIKSNKSS